MGTVQLSAETIQVGKKYYDPLRFVWDGSPGLNGKCSPQYNGDGSPRTEAQCGSGSWTPSTCVRVSDNVNMQSGGYESECLERNYAGQTTSIEGTTVALSAADQVQLEAPNMINMVSDVMMSRQVAFSYEDGSDIGNMLMIYNADDDLVMTNSGNVSPGTSGIFFRASIGWICGTCA